MINKLSDVSISWLIIGVCTGRKAEISELCQRYPDLIPMRYGKIWTAQPKLEWVAEIVQVADRAGVKVFLKDNLAPLLLNLSIHDANAGLVDSLLDNAGRLRQELPG